jgi:prephenate dehydrogenase
MIRSIAVVGTGLIGTSVALAARRRGVTTFLADRDRATARAAEALGAGRVERPPGPVDLAVIAVPPGQVGAVLAAAQVDGLAAAYTDVASVKGEPERAALHGAPDPSAYVGGHPMAGRERSGPAAARADLFDGRSWLLTPSAVTSPAALERGLELTRLCGATPVVMSSAAHDEMVALISHLPHLVASLMAARLAVAPADATGLAGPGVRDVTRIAAGDPSLWADIVRANAPAVARVMRELCADACRVADALEEMAAGAGSAGFSGAAVVGDLLERGVAGTARLA